MYIRKGGTIPQHLCENAKRERDMHYFVVRTEANEPRVCRGSDPEEDKRARAAFGHESPE